jgi:multidrug efflux system membrane fusion protein
VFDRSAQKKIASGQLLALDNQIDTTTGTVKVRAQFDNKDNALFPNQFVNTRLLVNTLQGVTLIPAAAVQQNGSASFVYVIQNNVAALRTIKTGVTDGGVTQVDGIQPAMWSRPAASTSCRTRPRWRSPRPHPPCHHERDAGAVNPAPGSG